MTERPIIMQPESVRAILEGRKTKTRRVVKPQPENDGSGGVMREADSWIWRGGRALLRAGYGAPYVHTGRHAMERAMLKVCPYGVPGDRLWVRETWALGRTQQEDGKREVHERWTKPRKDLKAPVLYRANQLFNDGDHNWKSPRFMPRWACRLVLELVKVRVELLGEITENDARAEGIFSVPWRTFPGNGWTSDEGQPVSETAVRAFEDLWHSIHGAWLPETWVWVLEFKK
jgi:hypothetical protein